MATCAVLFLVTQSCPALCNPMDCSPPDWDSPGKNIGVGCHALLSGIFPTQGSDSGLLHCSQILYQLSYQGSSNGHKPLKKEKKKKESVCQWRGHGSEPWSGRIPPTLGQLNLSTTTTETQVLSASALVVATREATMVRSSHTATSE